MPPRLNFNPYGEGRPFPLLLLFLGLFFAISSPGEARPVPPLTGPVVDEPGLLPPEDRAILAASLLQLRQHQGPQIQVLILDSLEEDILEEFSIKAVEAYQLGSEKKDDGVLFLLSFKDRKMRIEVGQGLEGDLPDILAGKILRQTSSYFQSAQYKEGVFFAVESIAKALGHSLNNFPSPPPSRMTRNRNFSLPFPAHLLFFLIFVFFLFLSPRGRFGNRGGFHWGGGGRSGGGGISWGGGGGGFSGGGASGDW